MRRIFVRTYGSGFRRNARTFLRPLDVEGLIKNLKGAGVKEELEKYRDCEDVRLWDFGQMAAKRVTMEKDDVVCVLAGHSLYYGEVVKVIRDPDGEIGDAVGWKRFRQYLPYRNPVLLKNVVEISGLMEVLKEMRCEDRYVGGKLFQLAR